MEKTRRKVIKVGSSKAVVIPGVWFDRIRKATGLEVEEVEVEVTGQGIKIWGIINDSPYKKDIWMKDARKGFIEKAQGECSECHEICASSYLILHHIKSRRNGGMNNYDNLRIVCRKCHIELHQPDMDAARKERHANYIPTREDITAGFNLQGKSRGAH